VCAFLVGTWDENGSRREAESLNAELAGLVRSLGHEVAGSVLVRIRGKHAAFGTGAGKAREIADTCAGCQAACLILDWKLTPSQQRNWENLSGIPVLDRRELIIQIFASRARTREAALQAELAGLTFRLPRLSHKYINLARQRGGSYGAKGSGETKFETDRRAIKERIARLGRDIEQVRKQRSVQRKRRGKEGARVCALVGYTNSGKSSLLNALTGAAAGKGALAEDKLFATLDTTTRRLYVKPAAAAAAAAPAEALVLTDTVGFIRSLPHDLISAFRSTLEELRYAHILIHVVDASSPDAREQYQTCVSVLRELGEDKKPVVSAINKIDADGARENAGGLMTFCENPVPVSARTGEGLSALTAKLLEMLPHALWKR
jgi:GTP-binding protein HflX